MSVLSDLATHLAAAGLGIYDTSGNTSTIYTHKRPDKPDACLSVELYGGAPPGPMNFDSTGPEWENPRVQIVARDPDGDTALSAANRAYKALNGLSDVAIGGVHYFSVRAIQQPFSLGTDENNLFLYVFNVQAQKVIT
jgi:hypothetical protein